MELKSPENDLHLPSARIAGDDKPLESTIVIDTTRMTATTAVSTTPAALPPPPRRHKYRGGFSTSICSLFRDPTRRNDCCALACCGILSSDRNRYLLTKELPPPWYKRVGLNIGLPLFLLLVVTYVEPKLSILFWVTIIGLFVRAIILRKRFRDKVIARVYLEEHGEDSLAEFSTRESLVRMYNCDTVCAHLTCGCYNNDGVFAADYSDLENDENKDGSDLCSCMWKFVSVLCCCCGCWIQFFGMCAIGQEEREMNTLIPKSERLFDYITFEPYAEYFPKIEQLRHIGNGNFFAHVRTLSQLSIKLLKGLGVILGCLFVFALTDIDSSFTILNMLVLLATFFQAFFILYLVHWKWNRFDVSLDAVVKYFSCGFILSISLALVFEMIVNVVVGVIAAIVFMMTVMSDPDALSQTDPIELGKRVLQDSTWVAVLYVFLEAFVVAALTEELCKYFGFWMVEHPDFMTRDELCFLDHAHEEVQVVSNDDDDDDDDERNNIVSKDSAENNTIMSPGEKTNNELGRGNSERSVDSIGKGITVAMVATGLGFACCENLSYVFAGQAGTTTKVGSELCVLFARSLFPIHPLCAAIQSIGVCRRDLEGDKSFQLGRIIFPAVLIHGFFDFALMVIAVLGALNTMENEVENNADDISDLDSSDANNVSSEDDVSECASLLSQVPSLVVGFVFVIIGAVYYMTQSRAQTARLKAQEFAKQSTLEGGIALMPLT